MFHPRRTVHGAIGALFGFVIVSVIAGLVTAVVVAPAAALTGAATSGTISAFQSLPSYLEVGSLMQKTDVYAGDPENPTLLASFYDQNRIEVTADRIAHSAKDALVASEDPRFYEHGGIDLQGTLRAIASTYLLDRDTQGGSSITQQYVKNVLVQKAESISDQTERDKAYAEATATTPERKLKEMRLAIGLEKEYSKDDILLGYLNIALFGGTVYGIEAAAQYYYGISAAELSVGQSAALLAIVNNPEKFRFDRPDDEANGAANGYAQTAERRDYILDRMLEYGKIDAATHDAAVAAPIAPRITPPSTGCQTAGNAAYFCDYVTHVLRDDPALGATDDERYAAIKRGGLKVYTTIDLGLQAQAQQLMDAQVPSSDPRFDVGATAVAVQAGTGRVLTMVQNKRYSQDPDVIASSPEYSAINLNVDADSGGGNGFQTGSAYKVFTLAEWLDRGHTLLEQFDSRQQNWTGFADSCKGTWNYDSYNPKNAGDGGYTDTQTALYSTVYSLNTGYTGMSHLLDQCEIRKQAEAFGVHRADGQPLVQSPGAVLGTNELAPLTMATAYAGIADNGMTCSPIAITAIVGVDGRDIAPAKSTCTRAVSTKVATAMQYAMLKVTAEGTGTPDDPKNGIQHITKTGTTDNSTDTWAIGASSATSLAVWVGSISAKDDASRVNLDSITFDSGWAPDARHRIWKPLMTAIDTRYGGSDFSPPDPAMVAAPQSTVPDVTGRSADAATQALVAAGLSAGSVSQVDSTQPKGSVAGTSPAAGSRVDKGSAVQIQLSTGNQPPPAPPSG
ncbi:MULTISPECIES: penicillin-binding protein [unclassified Rathayibacter]|uniref:penicillin-binding protein n=1 Tax=unclassified Rathayibacter TaxID=2609250 RepID=UPI00188BF786|nr:MULTISPECIES: transglycosylase domain-containing protein [unclassified Rathayibacter]MBF4463269.1 penicillin-binding protein [Rathayibacter sp. VKM Ac-2879]MBF4504494.1 penicillin-binding protein [Rathayibacter sp. VKM Ac-2878]